MESPRSEPISPERIGRYQLVTEISTGPLGPLSAAYVAAGAEEGRIVAVLRVPIGADKREVQQRISRAGIGAMSVRHARLAAILDVLPGPSGIAVVSEYVDAVSLRSLQRQTALARAPLPPPVAVAIAADVLRALRAARDLWRELHAAARDPMAGVVHGGLLPDSVTIASFGETMLADLAIAGAAASVPELLRHPDALPYRTPEQLAGEPADERSDVFTLGVLLWEMLANRPLFGAADRFKRLSSPAIPAEIERQMKSAAPRLDAVDRTGAPIPQMLVEIVNEALAIDREKRFPTIDALLDALRTLARDATAKPEQVSVAVDRLVRSELEARRVAIEMVASLERVSAMPESARVTAKPPPPEPPVRFAVEEAPTARRRQTPRPNTVAAVGAKKGSPLGRITAGSTIPKRTVPEAVPAPVAAAAVALPAPASERPALGEAAGSGVRTTPQARDSHEPTGGLAITPQVSATDLAPSQVAGPRRGRTVLVIVAVTAAVGLLALAMARGLGGSSVAAGSAQPSVGQPTTDVPKSTPKKSAEPQKTAQPETSAGPQAPEPSTEQQPEAPRSAPASAPATGKKPYRPRGI